jgi:hypothetical protein
MLIVDDCTRWMSVTVLKSKDQASSAFAKFKAEAENTLGYKIKMVRSDRAENSCQKLSGRYVSRQELEDNSLHHFHHNKMV